VPSVRNVSLPVKVEHLHTCISSICFTLAKLKWFVHATAAIWIIFSLLPKVAITKLHCSRAITQYAQDGTWTRLCQLNILYKTKCIGGNNHALWQTNNMSGNDPFGLYSLLPHFTSITHIPKMSVKRLLQQLSVCHDLVHCTIYALSHIMLEWLLNCVSGTTSTCLHMWMVIGRCDWYDWCT
jgi:hypothetical protein